MENMEGPLNKVDSKLADIKASLRPDHFHNDVITLSTSLRLYIEAKKLSKKSKSYDHSMILDKMGEEYASFSDEELFELRMKLLELLPQK